MTTSVVLFVITAFCAVITFAAWVASHSASTYRVRYICGAAYPCAFCATVLTFGLGMFSSMVAAEEKYHDTAVVIRTTEPTANGGGRLDETRTTVRDLHNLPLPVHSGRGDRSGIIRELRVVAAAPIGGGLIQVCAVNSPAENKPTTRVCATASAALRVGFGDVVYVRNVSLSQRVLGDSRGWRADTNETNIVITRSEVDRLLETGAFSLAKSEE